MVSVVVFGFSGMRCQPLRRALCANGENMNSKDVVLSFWNAMKTNDFAKASEWLSLDFEGFWPQSGELILGRENFVAINAHYPVVIRHSLCCM